MKKILIFLIILLFILPIIKAETDPCITKLTIEAAAYEKKVHNGSVILVKSTHQPNDAMGFVRQGDAIFVEKITADINASCLQSDFNKRAVMIQYKRPEKQEWRDDTPVLLQITNSKVDRYQMQLTEVNFWGAKYNDSLGNDGILIQGRELDEEGPWGIRIQYLGKERNNLDGFVLTNFKQIIPGQIEVEPRVSVSILDTNEQILEDSNNSSRRSILVAVVSVLVTVAVGGFSIFYMRKQLIKMDKQHAEQIKKQNQIEEDKQHGILGGLKQNINIIEDNMKGHGDESLKGTFSTQGGKITLALPSYDLNELDPIYYATNIKLSINNHSTEELKKLIFKVNDKVKQINGTLKTIKEFYFFDKVGAINIRDKLVEPNGPYKDLGFLLKKLKKELEDMG